MPYYCITRITNGSTSGSDSTSDSSSNNNHTRKRRKRHRRELTTATRGASVTVVVSPSKCDNSGSGSSIPLLFYYYYSIIVISLSSSSIFAFYHHQQHHYHHHYHQRNFNGIIAAATTAATASTRATTTGARNEIIGKTYNYSDNYLCCGASPNDEYTDNDTNRSSTHTNDTHNDPPSFIKHHQQPHRNKKGKEQPQQHQQQQQQPRQQIRNTIDSITCSNHPSTCTSIVISPQSSSSSSSSLPASASNSNSKSIPPWLAVLEEFDYNYDCDCDCEYDNNEVVIIDGDNGDNGNENSLSKQRRNMIRTELERLEKSLLSFKGGQLFSIIDVADIIRAIIWCSSSSSPAAAAAAALSSNNSNHNNDNSDNDNNNYYNNHNRISSKIMIGSVQFCNMMLQLDDENEDEVGKDRNNSKRRRSGGSSNNNNNNFLVTKDTVLACILHFSECVNAQYDDNVYEQILQQSFGSSSSSDDSAINYDSTAISCIEDDDDDNDNDNDNDDDDDDDDEDTVDKIHIDNSISSNSNDDDVATVMKDNNSKNRKNDNLVHALLPLPQQHIYSSPSSEREKTIQHDNNDFNHNNIFTIESVQLARAASRLKRSEILMNTVLSYNDRNNDNDNDDGGNDETDYVQKRSNRRPITKDEYADIRNLMVSITDDWRALAIRCVASLFRLEGALKQSSSQLLSQSQYRYRRQQRDQETILAAKDSLQLYASFSQQIGLHRLRSQIEAKAFRILYPRQFTITSILFREHGSTMKDVSEYLSRQLQQLLNDDSSLMYQLNRLQVLSRVKQPFSLWKKLLKTRLLPSTNTLSSEKTERKNNVVQSRIDHNKRPSQQQPQLMHQLSSITTKELSMTDVNDGIALRVILKARKLNDGESDETTRARERMLCYYIHHLLRSQWPETDAGRVKDYIRSPKKNGYQSLHHTSKFTCSNNHDFLFEIQIRTEEMDQFAEFGVAAHSAYKLASPSPSNESRVQNKNILSLKPATSRSTDNSPSALVLSSNEQNPVQYDTAVDCTSSGPYICALEKTRHKLVRTYTYVFVAAEASISLDSGQLLTLPAGSTIMDVMDDFQRLKKADFLFERESEVQVFCNGKIIPDNWEETIISNGDMIVIQPSKKALVPGKSDSNDSSSTKSNKTSSSNLIFVPSGV